MACTQQQTYFEELLPDQRGQPPFRTISKKLHPHSVRSDRPPGRTQSEEVGSRMLAIHWFIRQMRLTRTADNVPPRFHNLRSTSEIKNAWFRSFVYEIKFGQNAEGTVAVGMHIASKFLYLLDCHIDICWHESKHDRPWDLHTSQDDISSKGGTDDPAALIHPTAVIHSCRPWMT